MKKLVSMQQKSVNPALDFGSKNNHLFTGSIKMFSNKSNLRPQILEEEDRKPHKKGERIAQEQIQKKLTAMNKLRKVTPKKYALVFLESDIVKNMGAIQITSSTTSNAISSGGIYDGCLMPMKRQYCNTCYLDYEHCQFHSSTIQLPCLFVNPLCEYIEKYCNCICWGCGHTYVSEELLEASNISSISNTKDYIDALEALSDYASKLHEHPGHVREKYIGMKSYHLVFHYDGDKKEYSKDLEGVLAVFENLNETDNKILRFNNNYKAKSLLMRFLNVLPPNMHLPSMIKGVLTQNLYTVKYIRIIEKIIQISKEKDELRLNEYKMNLYDLITELFFGSDNTLDKNEKSSLFDLLLKKTGFIRGLSMGKPTEKCFRFVISPSVYGHGVCVVPREVAETILKTITCTKYNISEIKKFLNNGIIKKIYKKTLSGLIAIDLTEKERKKLIVEVGMKFQRCMIDGDYFALNRQPTLHKGSFLGVRAIISDDPVLRPSMSNVTGYNADFDGDEMGGHSPESDNATAELASIMSADSLILNEQNSGVIAAPTFNSILSVYLMTKKWKREDGNYYEAEIPTYRFKQFMMTIKDSPRKKTLIRRCKDLGINPNSGRACISVVFPIALNYKNNEIEIKNGILIKGCLNKKYIGTGGASLIGIVAREFSLEEAARMITEIMFIASSFLTWQKFSITLDSYIQKSDEPNKEMNEILTDIQLQFFKLGKMPADEIKKFFWKRNASSLIESSIVQCEKLSKKYQDEKNELVICTSRGSGVKGSEINIVQTLYTGGLQYVQGDFQKQELNDSTRSLPFYITGSIDLENYGFIRNSYIKGLNIGEIFFQASSAREGAFNTSVNTQKTGYLTRKMGKSGDSTIYGYKSLIMTTMGKIIRFSTVSLNPAYCVKVQAPSFNSKYSFIDVDLLCNIVNGIYDYIDNFDEIPEEIPDYELPNFFDYN